MPLWHVKVGLWVYKLPHMFKIDTVGADLWSFSKGCNHRTHSTVAPKVDLNVTFDLSTNT